MRSHRRLDLSLLALLALVIALLGQAPAAALDPPAAFGKNQPPNGTTGMGAAVYLSWDSATGAATYQYCYDTINNNTCDGPWASAGAAFAVIVPGLAYSTTYYWQVQAVNAGGTTVADAGAWWSFTTVAAAPPNDAFAAATVIPGLPYSTAQSAAGATTAGDDPTFTCTSGKKYLSVWFRYTATSAQPFTINTNGSNYDTVLGVWTGSAGSLTNVACNDDFGGSFQATVEVAPTPGTVYHIEVASYGAAPTSSPQLVLNVAPTPSVPGAFAKAFPGNGATGIGPTTDLTWAAAPLGFAYRYCYDTTNNGACNDIWRNGLSWPSTTITGLAYNTTYYWQVEAVNALGATPADSGTWWSFTTVAGPPPNDDFDAATGVGVPFTATQTVAGATTAADDPAFSCTGSKHYRSVWFRYAAASSDTVIVDTIGSDYDTVLGVWTGSRGSLTSVACNDDSLASGRQSRLEFTPAPGTTYYIEAASYAAGAPGSQLTLHAGVAPAAFSKTAPANGATGVVLNPTLSWQPTTWTGNYQYCYDTTNDGACDGDWVNAGSATSAALSGLSPSTTYYWQVEAVNVVATEPANAGSWWSFTTGAPVTQEMTFYSESQEDGWVLEQDENSGKGGTFDAGVATARVGDDETNRQWRSILHFNTAALPDGAVVSGLTLRIKRQTVMGGSPFDTHGFLVVDIKAGAFHENPALEKFDFQAIGSRGNVGRFIKTPASGWYRAPLRAVAYPLVNLTGATQLRLRFATDDDNDGIADFLNFYTGNAMAGSRPELIVTYYVP